MTTDGPNPDYWVMRPVPAHVDCLARETAALVGVTGYRVMVDDARDAAPGSGYAHCESGLITVSSATVRDLTGDEVMSVLAHEMAHLWRGPRRSLLTQVATRPATLVTIVIVALTVFWALFSISTALIWGADTSWANMIPAVAFTATAALCWFVVDCRASQREELACDIVLAHAIGTRGLQVLRFDRLHASRRWVVWLTSSHPHPAVRAHARRKHAHPGCCVERSPDIPEGRP